MVTVSALRYIICSYTSLLVVYTLSKMLSGAIHLNGILPCEKMNGYEIMNEWVKAKDKRE